MVPKHVTIYLEMSDELSSLNLPAGVDRRLHDLLDKQDQGKRLAPSEREEAEGLVELAEILSLIKLRAEIAFQKGKVEV